MRIKLINLILRKNINYHKINKILFIFYLISFCIVIVIKFFIPTFFPFINTRYFYTINPFIFHKSILSIISLLIYLYKTNPLLITNFY